MKISPWSSWRTTMAMVLLAFWCSKSMRIRSIQLKIKKSTKGFDTMCPHLFLKYLSELSFSDTYHYSFSKKLYNFTCGIVLRYHLLMKFLEDGAA